MTKSATSSSVINIQRIGLTVTQALVDAIEAEARAELLAELRTKVEGLYHWGQASIPPNEQTDTDWVSTAAVLALLAEPLGNSKP